MVLSDPEIRILHLSDFHMGKDDYGQKVLLEHLLEHIASRKPTAPPDLVLITGDIANKAKKAEYAAFVDQFLEPLKLLLPGVPVFIVPGNHDVDREEAEAAHHYDMLGKCPFFFDPTERGHKQRSTLFPRFQTYIDTLEPHVPCRWLTSLQGSLSEIVHIKGQKLGLLLLNTAWLAGGDGDECRLRLTKATVAAGLAHLKDAQRVLALGHHPLSWLHKADQKTLKTIFGRRHVLYLSGHVHQGEGERTEGAGQGFLTLGTGAAFQERENEQWVNGFQWYRLPPGQNQIWVEPQRWNAVHDEWCLDSGLFPTVRKLPGKDQWFFDLPGTTLPPSPQPNTISTPIPVLTAEPEPTPNYPSVRIQKLAESLASLEEQLERAIISGLDSGEIKTRILGIKRDMREGGRRQVGEVLQDRYKLLDILGRGGFAKVWKAYDRKLKKLVAVKMLHGQFGEDRTRRERFFRGARLMADLDHPGVVKVLQPDGVDEGFHFFVMAYYEGGNLHEYVVKAKRSTEELLALICQVGEALQFAHDRGYVHRDVKPANILLHENRAYLTDFDLVKGSNTTGGTRTNAGMGSFLYAPMEQWDNAKDAGPEVDVFSLGKTTLFALHGKELPAISYHDSSQIIQALTCANHIKRAISQAVAWQVEERTSSVAEFCRALLAEEAQEDVASISRTLGDSWIYVAPGSFLMGDDSALYSDGKPQHPVRISEGFWMGRFTVTNAEYRRFVDAGGYGARAYWSESGWAWQQLKGTAFDQWYETTKKSYEKSYGFIAPKWYKPGETPLWWEDKQWNGDKQPVVGISWYEAEAYCKWLTESLGSGMVASLPTEAQWEWAARGSENRKYPWGKQTPDETRANFSKKVGKTTEEGTYPSGRTPEGIEDMAGNVWEWCWDPWAADVYTKRTAGVEDPIGDSDDATERVLRGGAWYGGADHLRASYRYRLHVWGRIDDIGFRCVLRRLSPERG